jgi:hypothetical protein
MFCAGRESAVLTRANSCTGVIACLVPNACRLARVGLLDRSNERAHLTAAVEHAGASNVNRGGVGFGPAA